MVPRRARLIRKQTDPAAAAGKLMRNNFEAAKMSYGSSAAMDAVYMLGCSVAISGPLLLGEARPVSRPCAGAWWSSFACSRLDAILPRRLAR